jgi:type VI secretion system protein ImpH
VEAPIRGEGVAVSDQVLEPYPAEDEGGIAPEATAQPTGRSARPGGDGPLDNVEDLLRREPGSFGFFQAVRVLRQLRSDRAAVGRFVDPAEEVIRFSVPASISFPPSEIQSLELPEAGPARMSVNFFGLTGPQGLLPHYYTLLIAERDRARDTALGEFFDLFHHRALSLFYRAWEKYRFTVPYERGEEDALTVHLRDLAGVGLEESRKHLPVPEDALLFYTGLLGPQPRGAQGLQQLLADYFDFHVEVEQFVGRWYPIPRSDQCELGDESSPSNQLGLGAVAGDEIWDAQTCVRVRIGPLTREQYDSLLPGGEGNERLRQLTRFYCHDQFDFELQLVLARDEVPGLVLGGDGPSQPLGWSTWVRTREFTRDADETVLTL